MSHLQCFQFSGDVQVELVELPRNMLDGGSVFQDYRRKISNPVFGNLKSCANFARFFFHSLLTDVPRAIYLDVDVVVQGDLAELWEESLHHNTVISAAKRGIPYKIYYGPKIADLFEARYGKKLDLTQSAFNAGIAVLNLEMWRKQASEIDSHLHYWMSQFVQSQDPLWSFGTQPLVHLLFASDWSGVDPKWNVASLGELTAPLLSDKLLRTAGILHWTGKSKPWTDTDNRYRSKYWLPYRPVECQQGSRCQLDDTSHLWSCV